jgi:sugar/nucleoside kinase (ribokinase family)
VDLLCVGDVMLDVHAASGTLARGGDVHGHVVVRPGGTSANAAVWAAWDGAAASVIACVGTDVAGDLLRTALAGRGVAVDGVRRREAPTGVMLVMVEQGERSMVADRGANALLEPADLGAVAAAGAVLVSGYLLLQEPGREVATAVLDRAQTDLLAVEAASWPLLASFGVERFFEETERATVVLANDVEARTLTGLDAPDAARVLGERYRCAVVKRGAAGAVACVDGESLACPAEPIDEVDPTGAGDAFDGVFLAALARGIAPQEALARACHAGALVAGSRDNWPREVAA